jgi:hypothetical protein
LHVIFTEIAFPHPDFDLLIIAPKKPDIYKEDNNSVEIIDASCVRRKPTPALEIEQRIEKKNFDKMQAGLSLWTSFGKIASERRSSDAFERLLIRKHIRDGHSTR